MIALAGLPTSAKSPITIGTGPLPGPPGTVVRYARNEEIFSEGHPADFIYRVRSGSVRIFRVLSDGRRMIESFRFTGDSFGIEPTEQHSLSAEAVTDTEIVATPRTLVVRRSESDQAFSRELWHAAVAELAEARKHMLVLACQSAIERVGSFLVEIAERNGTGDAVNLTMCRQDIADYLGLTIETVSRTITELAERGAIEVPSARRILLRDRSLLRCNA